MFVSSSPCVYRSLVIPAGCFVIGYGVLVGAESVDVNARGMTGPGGELLAGDKPAATAQRNQLRDSVAVARDGEGLPIFNGVHDFLGSVAKVTLSDLRMRGHGDIVARVWHQVPHRGTWISSYY
jgi:hypothetical protein